MNANERCDGTVYGRPSCCKAGLICDGDGVCKGCSQTYEQCGGEYWTGAECCTSGNSCVFVDRYYSQCRPLSSFTIGDGTHPSYVRQYRSTNNSSTEIQRHPLRVKKNGSSAAVDFGPARIDVATRTTFVSFKMNTTRNVGRKYQRARPTMANAVVVCGRKTPAALSTAAAIRVITASRKTNIIRSVARYERNGLPCARTYEQCGGSLGPNGPRCCANSGDYCFVQDAYYAQCRPKMFS